MRQAGAAPVENGRPLLPAAGTRSSRERDRELKGRVALNGDGRVESHG